MPIFWVFWEWVKDWEKHLFYVDAKKHDRYIQKQQFDAISKERIVMVQDDCFEILSNLSQEDVCATIQHYINDNATLYYN